MKKHAFGDAAEHELAIPIAAVGTHDDQIGIEGTTRPLELPLNVLTAGALALDLHVPVREIAREMRGLRSQAVLASRADDDHAFGTRE